MSHFARLNADTFYVNGVLIPAVYFQGIDTAQFKSINGDVGGTWNPGTGLFISGTAGMWCASLWTLSAGALETIAASGLRGIHGDNDFIQLAGGHTGATFSLLTSLGAFADLSGNTARVYYDNGTDGANTFVPNGTYVKGARLVAPLRVHHGATLSAATLSFKVGQAHASTPQSFPLMRIVRVDALGNVTTLASTVAIAGGYTPLSTTNVGATWYAAGAVQTFTYTLAASSVVDTTQYVYFLEIVDEAGTSAASGNFFLALGSTMTLVPDLRPG